MANKTITIEITGDALIIDPALDAFVRQNGWVEIVDGEPNPQTKAEKARELVRAYIMETVRVYNIEQARIAAAQTDGALGLTTMTLTVA